MEEEKREAGVQRGEEEREEGGGKGERSKRKRKEVRGG